MAAITQAHQGIVPNRPHDYLYDNTYTVSGRVDHLKQMSKSQGQQVIINPEFSNMFSALRHYPPMQYRLKLHSFPVGMGQDRRTVVEASNISGSSRFKYFKSPLTQNTIFGGMIVFDKRKTEVRSQPQEPEPELPTKTVSVQTTYRESEAQTDPYSPDYIFKPNEPPPELMALSTLVYGSGLPVGMAELEMIERARQKRQWEQSLPVVTDKESFEKRLRMMEEMELKEWTERELEIKRLQDQRLRILEEVIRKRENENEKINEKRVERIWQNKMQEKEIFFNNINRKRMKALRKISERRQNIDQPIKKRDIIEEYGNFASNVYAPKARNGAFVDKSSITLNIDIPSLADPNELEQLEKNLKQIAFEAKISQPIKSYEGKTPEARREKNLKEQLEFMSKKLQERKKRAETAQMPLKYVTKIEKPAARPPTPTINIPMMEEEEMEIAAFLLQNILRGRAGQMKMYEGKERRIELINEMRTRHRIQKVTDDKETKTPTTSMQTVFTQDLKEIGVKFESAIQAEYVGKTLDFLTKELVRLREEKRIAAMVKLADRTRRMREAEESGRRQEELIRQREEDVIFRKIMKVHQESVDSFLEHLIKDSVDSSAVIEAKLQSIQYATDMKNLRTSQEQEYVSFLQSGEIDSEQVVSDLVTSFLIPYVEKQVVREQTAHRAVYNEVKRIGESSKSRPESPLQQSSFDETE